MYRNPSPNPIASFFVSKPACGGHNAVLSTAWCSTAKQSICTCLQINIKFKMISLANTPLRMLRKKSIYHQRKRRKKKKQYICWRLPHLRRHSISLLLMICTCWVSFLVLPSNITTLIHRLLCPKVLTIVQVIYQRVMTQGKNQVHWQSSKRSIKWAKHNKILYSREGPKRLILQITNLDSITSQFKPNFL